MDFKLSESFDLIIGHMSLHIEKLAVLDDKVNMSYGKQKLYNN